MKASPEDIFDEIKGLWQKERAETQMTLGKLISVLESMPSQLKVPYLYNPHSYMWYFDDLAFEINENRKKTVERFLKECKSVVGRSFFGYKGGKFRMDVNTPVWIAKRGFRGLKLIKLHSGGKIETSEDDFNI